MKPLKIAKVYYHPCSNEFRMADNYWRDHLAIIFGWEFIGYL